MANNTIGWGQGATNNDIGWGRGSSNDIGWGSVYDSSYVGDTDIVGGDTRFIIRIDTTQAGSAADTFVLPWIGTYDVDWGDGNVDLAVTNTQTHVYASSGIYDVKVTAASGRIFFNNTGDKAKLIDISNWGSVAWDSMIDAFRGCSSLTAVSATDIPNFSAASFSCLRMFEDCTFLNSIDVSGWDMSTTTLIASMFNQCYTLTSIDVSNWNTSLVSIASNTFRNCFNLKADFSGLDIAAVTAFTNFALSTNINETGTTTNYDNTLISWAAQAPTSGLSIHFGNSEYTAGGAAEAARTSLQVTYGWTIVDGGPA